MQSSTDTDDPNRLKHRSDKLEPKWDMSSTASEEPKLPVPNNARVAPKRLNERKDRDEPRCEQSKTARVAPIRL